MSRVMTNFIDALRAADVRVSPAETLDAMRAADLVGYADRGLLKDTLSVTLAKTPEEKVSFDETFDRFFSFEALDNAMPDENRAEEEESEQPDGDEANDNEQQGEQQPGQPNGAPGGMPGGGAGEPSEGEESQQPSLMQMLQSGDRNALAMAIAQAGEEVGIRNIRFFTQRGLYGRRIMEKIGLDELTDAIIAAEREEGVDGERGRALKEIRENVRRDVDDYVERNLALFAQNEGKRLREEVLESVRLTNVEMRDFRLMHQLVQKMSKKLIALHSRRKKRARRGHLDVRQTIRHNVAFDGLMFRTYWKRRKVDRPDVMAICDVSGSVATVSRFLLMFLYSLGEVMPNVRSFAFSGHLGEVTDLFEEWDIEEAIPRIMRDWGGGSTDYGVALQEFADIALRDIDNRTTVIILGDARSNYGNPRADILKTIYERAKRVIILNPEPQTLWGTGDSEMLKLKPYSHKAITCGSLKDLERVVDDILRTAV